MEWRNCIWMGKFIHCAIHQSPLIIIIVTDIHLEISRNESSTMKRSKIIQNVLEKAHDVIRWRQLKEELYKKERFRESDSLISSDIYLRV